MCLYSPMILLATNLHFSWGLSAAFQAQIYKNDVGASSGAPAQDHFTYERGPEIVKLAL